MTIARAALFGDAAITPIGAPQLDVLAIAKRDLKAGETIDVLGGYTVYGEAETAAITARDGLLPIGVAVGCKLRRDVPKDPALTYADVEVPARAPRRPAARRAGRALRPRSARRPDGPGDDGSTSAGSSPPSVRSHARRTRATRA